MNKKGYPVWMWSLQILIGHPKILLRICLLISVLFVVLNNSFIFSLVFVMIFYVFHFHILMNFFLCFAGAAEGRAFAVGKKFLGLLNFATCAHCSPSSLFVFYNLSFPAQYINFSRFLSPSFNTHL